MEIRTLKAITTEKLASMLSGPVETPDNDLSWLEGFGELC